MGSSGKPNLAVGLITTRDAHERRMIDAAGLAPHVVEVIATIENVGDALAGETTTRFWLKGAGVDRELRVVHTPEILPGDAIEVTALWDLRDGPRNYVITVTADASSQIDQLRADDSSGTARPRCAACTSSSPSLTVS
ncbi:MAG TPA: CARDB domain-containing protein [Jiangellaceae bacterium]|nr:CARDB domain-containing protein [Jiangellaceae bacterium]